MRETTLGQFLLETGGSIKTGPFGTVLKASEYSQNGVPLVSVGEIGYGAFRIRPETPRVQGEVIDRLPEYVLATGDVVFGRKGAVDRSVWVGPEEDGYFLGSDGIRVRFGLGVDSRFMAYQLGGADSRGWLRQHAAGTTMASLNQPTLERVPIRVPPVAHQRAIAEVLGALDDKIAANTRVVETADNLCQLVTVANLQADVVGLSTIAAIVMGSSPPGTSFNESGIGTVFYQGVRDFGTRFPTNRVWTTEPLRIAEPGDTLVSVRAPVGRTNLAAELTCIGRGLAAVRSTNERPFTLLHLLRAAPWIWSPFEAEGTVFGSISKQQLANIKVPVIREASAVMVEARLSALEARLGAALRENEVLASTRDALLPLLMSGKLRVKDAERVVEEAI